MSVLLLILPVALVLCLILSAVVAYFYAKSITKPIRSMSQATTAMTGLTPDVRCSTDRNDEIGILARNINDMYQKLLSTISDLEQEIETVGKAEQEKLDFLLLASHELKTPITAVRGMIDGMIYNVGIYKNRDTYLKECQNSLEGLTELICRILETSKMDITEVAKKKEPADIGLLIKEIAEPYFLIAQSRNIEIELSDEQRLDYADKIDKQAKRITWLIRNLLTLAQLQADVLELKKESVYVKDILRDIQDSLEIMAELKGIQLICESDAAICISCDKHWMTEALLNIVKNSVEHTNEGGTVKVQVVQDTIATHIHIVDDGEGIDSKHLPHIFERFYKAGNASANSIGIGLAMAKQIILKQNGTITVASKKGVGTDFYVKLFRTETV